LFSDCKESDGGLCDYVTDEELELCQTLQPSTKAAAADAAAAVAAADLPRCVGQLDIVDTDEALDEGKTESSPHKEVLIGGDNNPSRR
jgi:hypothetical protein